MRNDEPRVWMKADESMCVVLGAPSRCLHRDGETCVVAKTIPQTPPSLQTDDSPSKAGRTAPGFYTFHLRIFFFFFLTRAPPFVCGGRNVVFPDGRTGSASERSFTGRPHPIVMHTHGRKKTPLHATTKNAFGRIYNQSMLSSAAKRTGMLPLPSLPQDEA